MGYEIEDYIDINGLIKPQKHWIDSGNGILYTAVYLVLTKFREVNLFKAPVRACHQDDGLLFRSPTNEFQEQWDNYLGLAAFLLFTKEREAARKTIWYGVKRFGMYDTDGLRESKDFLWRFPQVWILMWLAAFPFLKWIIFPMAWITSLFMKPARVDGSGTQLAWLYVHCCDQVFGWGFKSKLQELVAQFKPCSREYYSEGHPIAELINS